MARTISCLLARERAEGFRPDFEVGLCCAASSRPTSRLNPPRSCCNSYHISDAQFRIGSYIMSLDSKFGVTQSIHFTVATRTRRRSSQESNADSEIVQV